ncbi:transmembrane protein [Thalictrum thalictroides]|uniref:Transmembrane protein n=1 Tax=Thalictrum thalictroides TaxID=46969 RepID=A0A7J6WP51_THATH|nr:transmembrane protein [Thalictrum thalictroides]
MNYFKHPSSNDIKQVVPIQLEPRNSEQEVVKEVIKVGSISKQVLLEGDQEMISSQHVFFNNKLKETQFVDIKMDSPRSTRAVWNQIETGGSIQFDSKKEDHQEKKQDLVQEKEIINWKKNGCGFNIWKWRLTGIGALCSIGMAAATICIFILGNQQKHKHHQQNQKLSFQIYSDDKRFKQVVQHATKLNQAISSVRGVPINRAHITCGGYYVYDGL